MQQNTNINMCTAVHAAESQPQHRARRLLAGAITAAVMGLGLAGAGQAAAADKGGSDYQAQRAACLNGSSNEDRATCLKEAGAARQEAGRGGLTSGRNADQNAVARCDNVPASDKSDCLRRAQDGSIVSGSPAAGGVLRETVTTTTGSPSVIIVPAPDAPK